MAVLVVLVVLGDPDGAATAWLYESNAE